MSKSNAMAQQNNKNKIILHSKFKKTMPAYLILIVLLALSFFIYRFMDSKIDTDKKSTFDKAAISIISRFKNKDQINHEILSSMYTVHQIEYVVRDVFELYGSIPTSTYNSIICMSYVSNVKNSALSTFIFDTRCQGYYDLKIYPEGVRDDYNIVRYFVPVERNAHRSGYDIKTDPIFEQASRIAYTKNTFTSTPFYNIRPDTLGFFYMAPSYIKGMPTKTEKDRINNYEGIIALEIKADDFFKEALGKGVPSDTTVIFKVRDIDNNGKEKIIFSSENSKLLKSGFNPDISQTLPFRIGNRTIYFDFFTAPNFIDSMQNNLPIFALIIALLLSIMLFAFIYSMMNSRLRAMELAENMTRRQTRIMETSKDIIAVIDLDGNWKAVNPAIEEILKVSHLDIIGKNMQDLFEKNDDSNVIERLLSNKKNNEEVTVREDMKMKTPNGLSIWVSWSFTISPKDKEIYCIGRDVTADKIAEQLEEIKTKEAVINEQKTREVSESRSLFLKEFSYKLRTSLTSILGYLNLLSSKSYENEEERDSFVQLAQTSSEELFSYLSDINDRITQEEQTIELVPVKLNNSLKSASDLFKRQYSTIRLNLNYDSKKDTALIADKDLIINSFTDIFKILSIKEEQADIQVHIEINEFEGAAEIQITGAQNATVASMIDLFNKNGKTSDNILMQDKYDLITDFEILLSNMRRMKGFMNLETLAEEGNVIMINLPLASTIKNKQQLAFS